VSRETDRLREFDRVTINLSRESLIPLVLAVHTAVLRECLA
jgi:hypothetical protein